MHKIISTPQGPRVSGSMGGSSKAVLNPQFNQQVLEPKFNQQDYENTMNLAKGFKNTSTTENWPQVGEKLGGIVIFPNTQYRVDFWNYHRKHKEETGTPEAKRKKPDHSQPEITRYFRTPHQAEVAPEVTKSEQLNTLIDLQRNANERLEKLITSRKPETEQLEKAKQKQQEFLEAKLAEYQEEINSILSKLQ